MRFKLDARLVFSKDVSEHGKKIGDALDTANSDLLLRGVPKHMDSDEEKKAAGAQIMSWKVEGQELFLNIESGNYVRAHEAVLRLRKFLGQELGKEIRAGIRQAFLDTYSVVFELPFEPLKELKIPFAEEVLVDGKTCTLVLKDVKDDFVQKNSIDRMITRLKAKCEAQRYEGKAEFWQLKEEHGEGQAKWDKDPTEEMLKLSWLKQGPTKGKWFYRPQLARVLRTMQEIAMEEFMKPLGFQEVIASHMVPFDVWVKTGHMEGVPNEVYYISEPKTRDAGAWEEFVDHVNITRQVPREMLPDLLTLPNAGTCYAQCPVIYWSLQGETISTDSLPIQIYDMTANSNRYESGGRHGIERVDEFHRMEPVYIGTPEQLVNLRENMLDRYRHIFNDILELDWRMAWVTPFYMQQAGQVAHEEDVQEHVKGTIDFEAYLPYRGTRKDSEWLEFQNLSIMGDKYTKAFNIKSQSGEELWSGCSGIGLERWTAAFLAQKGLDSANWPKAFLERLGELPSGIKLL